MTNVRVSRRWHALECIEAVDRAFNVPEPPQSQRHHHGRAAPPDTTLHEIAGDAVPHEVLDGLVERIETLDRRHGRGLTRGLEWPEVRIEIWKAIVHEPATGAAGPTKPWFAYA